MVIVCGTSEARTRSALCGVIIPLIYVVGSNDRNRVEDAKEKLSKMIEDEMCDAVVIGCAST